MKKKTLIPTTKLSTEAEGQEQRENNIQITLHVRFCCFRLIYVDCFYIVSEYLFVLTFARFLFRAPSRRIHSFWATRNFRL